MSCFKLFRLPGEGPVFSRKKTGEKCARNPWFLDFLCSTLSVNKVFMGLALAKLGDACAGRERVRTRKPGAGLPAGPLRESIAPKKSAHEHPDCVAGGAPAY